MFRYIDDVLSLNNKDFSNFLHLIYPVELVFKDTTDSPNSAPYLDLYLEHDINGTLTTKLYVKRRNKLKIFKLKIDDGCRLNKVYHEHGSVGVVKI